jgi:uncharacterized damage-inducible protein DinB
MAHLLVNQLCFARSEFMRCLEGITPEDAIRRIGPMNCISWTVGHLANQENRYWVMIAQSKLLAPELNEMVGYGKPATTPPLADMLAVWSRVTTAADAFLDSLTPQLLQVHFEWKGKPVGESAGTMLLRNIYHYWYHLGEIHAVREQLGHTGLPEYVGDMDAAVYFPEVIG